MLLHLPMAFHSQSLRQLFPYFTFFPQTWHWACLPPSSHLVRDLVPVSLGEVVEIRALPHSPASNLNLLLGECDLLSLIPMMNFPCSQIWITPPPPFVCWIPAYLFYSRIFLEFYSLISLHHQGVFFFSQLFYSHHYSNISHLKEKSSLDPHPLQLLFKMSAFLYTKASSNSSLYSLSAFLSLFFPKWPLASWPPPTGFFQRSAIT